MLKADLVMNKDDIEERMDTRLNRIEDMMLRQMMLLTILKMI